MQAAALARQEAEEEVLREHAERARQNVVGTFRAPFNEPPEGADRPAA
jgi:hypothetical protein